MEMTILVLLIIACLLFILSFFRKDRTAILEKQLEDLSMTYMQEMYQLKKKIRLLEDELLLSSEQSPFQKRLNPQQQLVDEIISYYNDGDDLETIAKKTGLTRSEVEHLLPAHLRQEDGVSK